MVTRCHPSLALSTAVFAVALLPACQPEFDDRSSQVRDLRVLAVRSEPAEGAPKRTPLPPTVIKYTALVAGPNGTVADAPIEWAYCTQPKPVSELNDVSTPCFTTPTADFILPFASAGTSVSAPLPGNACNQFGPDVPDSKPPGRPADPDATGGYYQPVRLLINRGAAYDLGFAETRILCNLPGATNEVLLAYQRAYRPNENPAIAQVQALAPGAADAITLAVETAGDSGLTVTRGTAVKLSASWDACSAEPACGNGLCESGEDVVNPDHCPEDCATQHGCTGAEAFPYFDLATRALAPRREAMRISWYANAGAFADDRTGRTEEEIVQGLNSSDNTWTAPTDPQVVTLWLVLRDSRGGMGWRSYRVNVE